MKHRTMKSSIARDFAEWKCFDEWKNEVLAKRILARILHIKDLNKDCILPEVLERFKREIICVSPIIKVCHIIRIARIAGYDLSEFKLLEKYCQPDTSTFYQRSLQAKDNASFLAHFLRIYFNSIIS